MREGYTFIAGRTDLSVETHILHSPGYPYLLPTLPHMLRGVTQSPPSLAAEMEENIESESRVFECLSVTCTPLRTKRQVGEAKQNTKPVSNTNIKYCEGCITRFRQQFFNIRSYDIAECHFCYTNHGSSHEIEKLRRQLTLLAGHFEAIKSSSAQPTALIMRLQRSAHTDSLPSTSKVNISTNNSHHLNNLTHSEQQIKESRNQPSCLRVGWDSSNPRTNKCKCSTYTSLHPAGNTSTTSTNEWSRSGIIAQPTVQNKEAGTHHHHHHTTVSRTLTTKLFRSQYLPTAQSQHLHLELPSHEELNSQPTAEQRKQKSAILSADRMSLNSPRTTNNYALQLYRVSHKNVPDFLQKCPRRFN
ncbi:hypothetical protein FHG87_012109 [Trinorchestia longiramus]|nr:hypothetical protein FHG87_012109 [Trinorchestia longiramus]